MIYPVYEVLFYIYIEVLIDLYKYFKPIFLKNLVSNIDFRPGD